MLVSTVIADAGNFEILAIAKISAPALETSVVLAPVPADADTLPLLPRGNTGAYFVNDAGHFVPWNAGILNTGQCAFFRDRVTVSEAASFSGSRIFPEVPTETPISSLFLSYQKMCPQGKIGSASLKVR